jgi:hypothetical protein
MIFQITVLIAVLLGPTSPPILVPMRIPENFISMTACEEVRTSKDFIKATMDSRATLLKKYKNSSVSIASKCVDTSSSKQPKFEAI